MCLKHKQVLFEVNVIKEESLTSEWNLRSSMEKPSLLGLSHKSYCSSYTSREIGEFPVSPLTLAIHLCKVRQEGRLSYQFLN